MRNARVRMRVSGAVWIGLLVALPSATAQPDPGRGTGADSCANADPIAGSAHAEFPFDTTGATTDGPLLPSECESYGDRQIYNDVWFCWTSDVTGTVTVMTCDDVMTLDTEIAVYAGCTCPPGAPLACDDDGCFWGDKSRLEFSAVSGQQYLIRIGAAWDGYWGTGVLTIIGCAEPGTCSTAVGCQHPYRDIDEGVLASASDLNPLVSQAVADNLTVAADGAITAVCWWGMYTDFATAVDCGPGAGDTFSITYYNDDNGGLGPGTIRATHPLTLTDKFITNCYVGSGYTWQEWQYGASHPPITVSQGECLWISITNDTTGSDCYWNWTTSDPADGRSAYAILPGGFEPAGYDLAWCLDTATDPAVGGCLEPLPNDLCADAEPITGEGVFAFDNSTAETDGPDHAACEFFDQSAIEHDVWYCWTATVTGPVRVETCGITQVDTKIAVYDGCACPPTDAALLACNDDDCGVQSGLVFNAVLGQPYLIRLGTYPSAAGGTGQFSVQPDLTPVNDRCEYAAGPLAVPSTTAGTTEGATIDTGFPSPCGGATITAPGVWYNVVGTGSLMTASLCNGATTYDSKLSLFSGVDCYGTQAVCVGGNDDFCGYQSELTWCSDAGVDYHILVHGYGDATGPFELEVNASLGLDCNYNGYPDECESSAGGDFDADGDVDLSDFEALAECLAGPDEQPSPAELQCLPVYREAFDADGDGDVDVRDFAAFQRVFTVP